MDDETARPNELPGWNEVTELSDLWSFCLPVQCWVPQLVLNKLVTVGDINHQSYVYPALFAHTSMIWHMIYSCAYMSTIMTL